MTEPRREALGRGCSSTEEETHIKERNSYLGGIIAVIALECGSIARVPKRSIQKFLVQVFRWRIEVLNFIEPAQVRTGEAVDQAIPLREASNGLFRSERIDRTDGRR